MSILFFISFLIVIILILVYRSNAHKNQGAIGESSVARQLNRLQDNEYLVLNDILIETDTGSSQIDHIVISIYGIFVIETKNYSGWIHGNDNSEYWTQSIYLNKTRFRNPIRQNWSHIFALKKILSSFKQATYHSIVVFAGSAELKNVVSKIPVIYVHQLFQTIMAIRGAPNLNVAQVNKIAHILCEVNVQDSRAKKEHVNQVRKHVDERIQKEKSLICPNCSGNLIVRQGPYGKFYGCSNYPRCRYKLSYEEQ